MTHAISLGGTHEESVQIVAEAADLLASPERRDWFVAVGRMAGDRRAERRLRPDLGRGSRAWLACWVTTLILGCVAAFTGAAAILPGKHESLGSSRDSVEGTLLVSVPALWVALPLLLLCALAPIPRAVGKEGAKQAMAAMCAVLVIGVPTLVLVLTTWSSYAEQVAPARLALWAALLALAQVLAAVAGWRLWRRWQTEKPRRPVTLRAPAHLEAARLAEIDTADHAAQWQRRVRALGLSTAATDQAITLGPAGYLAWAYYSPLSERLPRPVSYLRARDS